MRLKRLRRILWEHIVAATPRTDLDVPIDEDVFHILGTVHLAALLAERRGMDREVATAAMLLHDIGRLVTGRVEGHAQASAELAQEVLADSGFSPAEVEAICQAIETHVHKTESGTPLEELVRDADVLEVYLSGAPLPPVFIARVEGLRRELGLARG